MSENNNEVMDNEVEGIDLEPADYSVEEGGSGKAIGLTVGLITGAVALGAAAYKKIKSKKKDEQPKKKKAKKRLKWVEVEEVDEPENESVIEEEIDEEAAEK